MRDKKNVRISKAQGIRSLRVWEHSLSKSRIISVIDKLQHLLSEKTPGRSISYAEGLCSRRCPLAKEVAPFVRSDADSFCLDFAFRAEARIVERVAELGAEAPLYRSLRGESALFFVGIKIEMWARLFRARRPLLRRVLSKSESSGTAEAMPFPGLKAPR